jgi:hypothetical protein
VDEAIYYTREVVGKRRLNLVWISALSHSRPAEEQTTVEKRSRWSRGAESSVNVVRTLRVSSKERERRGRETERVCECFRCMCVCAQQSSIHVVDELSVRRVLTLPANEKCW